MKLMNDQYIVGNFIEQIYKICSNFVPCFVQRLPYMLEYIVILRNLLFSKALIKSDGDKELQQRLECCMNINRNNYVEVNLKNEIVTLCFSLKKSFMLLYRLTFSHVLYCQLIQRNWKDYLVQ